MVSREVEKSTLLEYCGGPLDASSGSYELLNHVEGLEKINKKSKFRKRKILVSFFQNFNLIDELSVYDNIELP
jgi:putative ABC transport system ATP-binding protein